MQPRNARQQFLRKLIYFRTFCCEVFSARGRNSCAVARPDNADSSVAGWSAGSHHSTWHTVSNCFFPRPTVPP